MKHDPVTVVSAFNVAVSAQDLPAALALLDDTFPYVSGPGSALPTIRKRVNFPDSRRSNRLRSLTYS